MREAQLMRIESDSEAVPLRFEEKQDHNYIEKHQEMLLKQTLELLLLG